MVIALRKMKKEDQDLLVQFLNDESVIKYLSSRIPQPYTENDAAWWVDTGSKEDGIVRAIEFEGKFCGVIGASLQPREHSHSAEIGYWIAHQYWGKGIATKSLLKLTDYVFSQTEIIRLYAPVFSPNIGSMRVLEKSGYKLEGVFEKAIFKKAEYFDEHLFARVKT